MKTQRAQRVPLSIRAIDILKSLKSNHNPDDFIFMGGKINKEV